MTTCKPSRPPISEDIEPSGKWLAEKELREREIELKAREQDRLDKELDHKIAEAKGAWRAQLAQPLVLAVLAAAAAAGANVWVSWNNNENEKGLEIMKEEASRILAVISTNDPNKAATNLRFLLDVGLIQDKQTAEALTGFLSKRKSGEGPSLPASAWFRSLPSQSVSFELKPEGATVYVNGIAFGKIPLRGLIQSDALPMATISFPDTAPCNATNWIMKPEPDGEGKVVTCAFPNQGKSLAK